MNCKKREKEKKKILHTFCLEYSIISVLDMIVIKLETIEV